MTTDPGDLVIDPSGGSGTTAYVAEEWGRRWITIDTSRVALALARTRLMAGRFPYYLLTDSPDGVRKEAETGGQVPSFALPPSSGDIKKGFVYKRVPHITLKSIANNDEIDEIHARWQAKLEPIRTAINEDRNTNWEEWEIPRLPSESAREPASGGRSAAGPPARDFNPSQLLRQWWDLRRQRQKEIDDSIARRAETELLYNDPYEDPKCVRVTGPFTVESLSRTGPSRWTRRSPAPAGGATPCRE
jgi:adenine-specific DNA-methyltransferase